MYTERPSLLSGIESAVRNEPGDFSVAVINLVSGQELLFRSRPMRSASLIKLFIMAEVFARFQTGDLSPSQAVPFLESDRVDGGGLLQDLPAGTFYTIRYLTEIMITESDNIATNLLIQLLGEAAVNRRTSLLGASDTVLRRRMMDFAAAAAGQENLTSVSDVSRLLQKLYRGECVDSQADRAMLKILGHQTDRCKIPFLLPPGTLCQNKTGELPGAEHDAGVIYGPSGPYALTIMSDNLPDSGRGCQFIAVLSKVIYDYFAIL